VAFWSACIQFENIHLDDKFNNGMANQPATPQLMNAPFRINKHNKTADHCE